MNPLLHFIFNRRSVRKYENREIPADKFNDLFEAAMAAPSAVAKDPWHFLLIRNRKTLDSMVKILPNGQMLRQAPAAVIVCGDISKTHANQDRRRKDSGLLLQACCTLRQPADLSRSIRAIFQSCMV